MSVLRAVRKRKKVRKLGSVNIIRREAYADLELDAKVELIRSLVPLGLMHVQELLDQEVTALASERYGRKDASVAGRRHGSNPGTVGLAGQRVPIRVPRIRRLAGSEIPLRSYEALHGDRDGRRAELVRGTQRARANSVACSQSWQGQFRDSPVPSCPPSLSTQDCRADIIRQLSETDMALSPGTRLGSTRSPPRSAKTRWRGVSGQDDSRY